MGDSRKHQDADLVKRCLAGSEEAWQEFHSKYMGLVRHVVKKVIGRDNPEEEDVVQNVFLDLISALKRYDPAYQLPRYVCMISERKAISLLRRPNPPSNPLDHTDSREEGAVSIISHSPSQEEELSTRELIEVVRAGLRSLGEKCRELLRLRYYEDQPYKEIAKILGATENALMVRSKRCLDDLRVKYGRMARKGKRR